VQFEFGPLSEASIGNVGMRPGTTGWVDHIVTPAGALWFTVAEDQRTRETHQTAHHEAYSRKPITHHFAIQKPPV
jgi:hypothetical protein